IGFVRGGLLRIDSPAALRGDLGARGLTIRLAGTATEAQLSAVRAVPGVTSTSPTDGILQVGATDPESIAPAVVRALVTAGGDVIEVRPEHTSLEQIYFDVMGVRPGADGELG
ncbi:MAG: ABC transporter ATP-binding protein, partial [Candidatus Limnocylindrales bacterium]